MTNAEAEIRRRLTRYDLIDLRVFLAVADARNVSHGAARCHLAPSSASLRLKGLEEAVGARLFARQARGVELTPAGMIMVDHARRCIAQLEQMHADLMPFAQGLSGTITVFANNNAISSHLPDDLARFFAAHPAVRITLEERLSSEVVSAVASGRADLGAFVQEGDHPELEYRPYRIDQLIVLASPSSRLAHLSQIGFSECFSEPFVCLQQGAALHTFLFNHAAALGGRLDIRVQVSGYRAIARMVASGSGIGIVPRSALEAGDHEHLVAINLAEPWARRELRIGVRRGHSERNPFIQKLIDTLCPP